MTKRAKLAVVFSTAAIVILILGATFTYLCFNNHQSDIYKDMEKIKYSDIITKDRDYYVYAYKVMCPYCKAIENEIVKFASQEKVYFLDVSKNDDRPRYDWDNHHMEYDIEIGESDYKGVITYYENVDIEFYKDQKRKDENGHYVKYKIVTADESYIKNVNSNGEIGKVYASLETPVLDYNSVDLIEIPAVPMLFNIIDGKVSNYYYDSDEIAEFLSNQGIPANGEPIFE